MAKNILSMEEVLHLAHLARLSLSEDEIKKFAEQFGETIDYIKNLDELETKDVSATNSVVDLKNVTYEDGEKNEIGLTIEEALQNAKKTKKNEFVVDRIM